MAPSPRLIEIVFRCLSDERSEEVTDCALLFSETPDNERSVIEAAASLVTSGMTRSIAVLESRPRCGYGGSNRWLSWFSDRGILRERVRLVSTEAFDILHTGTESTAFVQWARQQHIRTAHVVAAPFHQLRAFMTLVSVLLRADFSMRLYSHPGTPQDWQTVVVHSQAQLRGTRSELVAAELERIEKYRASGELASDDDIIKYLNDRRFLG